MSIPGDFSSCSCTRKLLGSSGESSTDAVEKVRRASKHCCFSACPSLNARPILLTESYSTRNVSERCQPGGTIRLSARGPTRRLNTNTTHHIVKPYTRVGWDMCGYGYPTDSGTLSTRFDSTLGSIAREQPCNLYRINAQRRNFSSIDNLQAYPLEVALRTDSRDFEQSHL
jgi:hypothetical protein